MYLKLNTSYKKIMSENYNTESYDKEIDFRKLIMVMWKKKVMIISIMLIFALIAGVFSKVILKPVYETNLNIVISMPETYMTRYGEYKLPITSNNEYIKFIKSNDIIKNTRKDMKYNSKKVTLQDLKDRITIGDTSSTGNVQNNFHVTVSAVSAEESLELANHLYENYIEFIDAMLKERAVSYYYNDFSVKIKTAETLLSTTKDVLTRNESLLAETPETINQVDAMKQIQKGSSDFVVLENVINPNYTKLEGTILTNKKLINTTESSITEYKANLEELAKEKADIKAYKETGDTKKLESSVLNLVDVSIYQPSQPEAPDHKSSPNTLRNVVIAGFLGGVLSVISALFIAYWKKEI